MREHQNSQPTRRLYLLTYSADESISIWKVHIQAAGSIRSKEGTTMAQETHRDTLAAKGGLWRGKLWGVGSDWEVLPSGGLPGPNLSAVGKSVVPVSANHMQALPTLPDHHLRRQAKGHLQCCAFFIIVHNVVLYYQLKLSSSSKFIPILIFNAAHFWYSFPWGWTKRITERDWKSKGILLVGSHQERRHHSSSFFSSSSSSSSSSFSCFSCCPNSACKPATEVAAIWKIHSFKIQKRLISDIPWTVEWKASLPGASPQIDGWALEGRLNRRGFGVIIN